MADVLLQQNLSFLYVCITSLKYNQFTNIRQMLPNEQDFQLLVDTKDYLNLQTRCNELELSHQKLDEQNKILANKIFELKEENQKLHKKVTGLTDDIRYLSQKGIQMSKSLMSLEEERQSLRLSKAEKELELGKKIQTVVVSKQQSEKKLMEQMAQIRKTKEELKQKTIQLQKILTVEKLSRHIQVSPNSKQACVMGDLTSTQIETTINANKSLKQKQADLQRIQVTLAQELSQKNLQINNLNHEIQKLRNTYQIQIDQLSCINSIRLEQTQKIKKQMSENQQKQKCLQSELDCHQKQKQQLMEIIIELKEQIQMLKMRNYQICQQKALVSQKMNQLQNRINNHVQKIKQKETQCCELTKNIKVYEQQINLMTLKLSEIENKNSQLIKYTNSLSCQIQDLRNSNSTTQGKLDTLKLELCQKEKECSKLSCKIQQMRAAQENKSLDLDFVKNSLQSRIEQLNLKISQMQKQNYMLSSQIKNKDYMVNELRTALENSQAKKQNQIKNSRIEQLQNEIQQMKLFIQQNLEKNLQENSNSAQKIRFQDQIIQELKQKIRILNEQGQVLKQKYGSVVQTLQNQKLENIKSKNMIKQLEQKLSLQSAKIVQYEQINKNLKLTQQSQQSHEFCENKIQCLQIQNKRLKDLLDNSRKLQKQYEEIIEGMQKQKQKKNSPDKNKKKDQLEQIKQAIQTYFLEIACNLHEVGNLDDSDIEEIINQNKQIVKNSLTRACESFNYAKNIKCGK